MKKFQRRNKILHLVVILSCKNYWEICSLCLECLLMQISLSNGKITIVEFADNNEIQIEHSSGM